MPNVKARHIKALTDNSKFLEWLRSGCPVKVRNKQGKFWLKMPIMPGLPKTAFMVMNHHPFQTELGAAIANVDIGQIPEVEISVVRASDIILPSDLFP